jgi:hypothetical protein
MLNSGEESKQLNYSCMIKIFLSLFGIFFLISSCSRSSISNSELEDAKRKVIKSHDPISYADIDLYYSNDYPELYMEQLPYDILMYKANDGYACYQFYKNYLKVCNSGIFDKLSISKLEKPEQDFLLYILNKGALLKEDNCRQYLYYYYTNGIVVKKDSLKADSLSKFFPEGFFDNVNL